MSAPAPEPRQSAPAAPAPSAAPGEPAAQPSRAEERLRPGRPRRPRDEPGAERGDGRFPRGLALRLFVYVVAGHLLAGFLFLLFELGGGK